MAEYEGLAEEDLNKECKKIQNILNEERLMEQAEIFKVVGDLNRLKIINVLMLHESLCVYEVSRLIGASIATTSHHLITLKGVGLVTSIKEGKHVIYSLNTEFINHVFKDMHMAIAKYTNLKEFMVRNHG